MSLAAVAQAIRAMEIRGAAAIGREGALALGQHIRDADDALTAAHEGAELLLSSRPTAVTLRNGVQRVLDAMGAPDPQAAAWAAARRHAEEVDAAQAEVRRQAQALIAGDPRILTHCHSSTVVEALVAAWSGGADLQVTVTETRPWRQGHITARQLSEAGIPVRFIVDGAVLHTLRSGTIDQIMVGADTVTPDGALWNKIGTSQVALAAAEQGLPFLSLAASQKFAPADFEVVAEERSRDEVLAPDELPGVTVANPVFDRTPPDHITAYVTERGIVRPSEAGALRKRVEAAWTK